GISLSFLPSQKHTCTKMWQTFQLSPTSHLCQIKQVLRETSSQKCTGSPRTCSVMAAAQSRHRESLTNSYGGLLDGNGENGQKFSPVHRSGGFFFFFLH